MVRDGKQFFGFSSSKRKCRGGTLIPFLFFSDIGGMAGLGFARSQPRFCRYLEGMPFCVCARLWIGGFLSLSKGVIIYCRCYEREDKGGMQWNRDGSGGFERPLVVEGSLLGMASYLSVALGRVVGAGLPWVGWILLVDASLITLACCLALPACFYHGSSRGGGRVKGRLLGWD